MIDPAIIQLIHHLGQQPPAVVRSIQTTNPSSENATEQDVRECERWSQDWIATAQKKIDALVSEFEAGPISQENLLSLSSAIEILENSFPLEVKEFRKQQKESGRLQKYIKSNRPRFYPKFVSQRTRVFKAISRAALVRVELIFALKALRARHDYRSKEGPLFENSKDLGDYLRSAIA